ncbi:MAG: right-handed parallel beta-helix repeat-containing protein [Acidobacteriota bacterium]
MALRCILFLSLFVLLAGVAHGTVWTPTDTADGISGRCGADCTLRDAVRAANRRPGADVVVLGEGTYFLTLGGRGEDQAATGDLDLSDDLTIIGAGADRTRIDGRGLDRLFDLRGAVRLELVAVRLENGDSGSHSGGAVRALDNDSTVVLDRSVIADSQALADHALGGAIYSQGAVEITYSSLIRNQAGSSGGAVAGSGSLQVAGSTFSENNAEYEYGGGLYVASGGDLDLRHSTLHANRAMKVGGGVYVHGLASARVQASILARNLTWAGGTDCYGQVESAGFNLVGQGGGCQGVVAGVAGDLVGGATILEPELGPLALNGGGTPTHSLLPSSPARDAVAAVACAEMDQRGERRGSGDGCDIGAFEVTGGCVPSASTLCLLDGRFRVTLGWREGTELRSAQAVNWTADTGYFWFFDGKNVEVVVKAIDGCSTVGGSWVFASGLTNRGVELTVEDLSTGRSRVYRQDEGPAFTAIQDTSTFDLCP